MFRTRRMKIITSRMYMKTPPTFKSYANYVYGSAPAPPCPNVYGSAVV